jgi:hypothetical protein
MRKSIAFSTLLLLASLAGPGFAQGAVGFNDEPTGRIGPVQVQTGRIAYVDLASMSFVCRSGRTQQTYWATRATRIVSGRPSGSLFDLAAGQSVRVRSHLSGGIDVADQVILLP